MIPLEIRLDGDAAIADLKDERWAGGEGELVMGCIARVVALAGGMGSGLPSVAIVIRLPDGSYALGETSARLLVNAARAIVARFPEIDTAP